MFRFVLLSIVRSDLDGSLSNEVTVYAENHRIRGAGTKGDWSCRRFSQYLFVGKWYLILLDIKWHVKGETTNCACSDELLRIWAIQERDLLSNEDKAL